MTLFNFGICTGDLCSKINKVSTYEITLNKDGLKNILNAMIYAEHQRQENFIYLPAISRLRVLLFILIEGGKPIKITGILN